MGDPVGVSANPIPPDEQPPREPRTRGESTRLPVQIALVLLGLFIGLMVLWWVWPLITGA